MGAMQCKSGKNPGNHVNQRKLHMVHTLRFGKSTKVAHGRTRVKIVCNMFATNMSIICSVKVVFLIALMVFL